MLLKFAKACVEIILLGGGVNRSFDLNARGRNQKDRQHSTQNSQKKVQIESKLGIVVSFFAQLIHNNQHVIDYSGATN